MKVLWWQKEMKTRRKDTDTIPTTWHEKLRSQLSILKVAKGRSLAQGKERSSWLLWEMLEGKVNKPTLSFMLVEQNIDSTAILQKLLANNTSAYNKRIKKIRKQLQLTSKNRGKHFTKKKNQLSLFFKILLPLMSKCFTSSLKWLWWSSKNIFKLFILLWRTNKYWKNCTANRNDVYKVGPLIVIVEEQNNQWIAATITQ